MTTGEHRAKTESAPAESQSASSENPLPGLFHYRWAVPTLAALQRLGGGAKFVTLQRSLGASRDSLKRTLLALIDSGLVMRNPGYGHPLRPEYVLTTAGRGVASASAALVETLQKLDVEDVALRKWSLPLVHALATTAGRFNLVRASLGEVTPRALALALRDLQAAGLVERRLVDDNPPRTEYRLTRRGRRLSPATLALARAA